MKNLAIALLTVFVISACTVDQPLSSQDETSVAASDLTGMDHAPTGAYHSPSCDSERALARQSGDALQELGLGAGTNHVGCSPDGGACCSSTTTGCTFVQCCCDIDGGCSCISNRVSWCGGSGPGGDGGPFQTP